MPVTLGYAQILPKPTANQSHFSIQSVVHYENNEPAVSSTSINYITPTIMPAPHLNKPMALGANSVAQFTGADPSTLVATNSLPPVNSMGHRRMSGTIHEESPPSPTTTAAPRLLLGHHKTQAPPSTSNKTMPISIAAAGFKSSQ